MDWSANYLPGQSTLAISGSRLALLASEGAASFTDVIWGVVQDTSVGVAEILEVMSTHGMPVVSGAAVAVEDADGCLVLLRGAVSARADGRDMTATGRHTWAEAQIGSDEFVIRTGVEAGASHEGPWIPIAAGVVRCSAIRVTRAEPAMSAPAPIIGAGAGQPPPRRAGDGADPDRSSLDPDATRTAEAGGDEFDRFVEAARRAGRSAPREEGPIDDVPFGTTDAGDDSILPPPSLVPGPELPDLGSDVPSPPGPTWSSVAEPVMTEALIDSVPGIADIIPGGLIVEPPRPVEHVPSGPSSWADPGPHPQDPDEPDSLTRLKPSLAPGASGGVQVRAVVCPGGHANPPEAVACRVCGEDVGGLPVHTVTRPCVGFLRLVGRHAGAPETLAIDRSLVLGRAPFAAPGMDEGARLVVIPDPLRDVSRNHLLVTLEGWHVLVSDLASTNGTEVTAPGRPAQKLRAREAVTIAPGTTITLADSVTYEFEVSG